MVLLEDLSAIGQWRPLEESHVVCVTNVGGHPVVAGEDHASAVSTSVRGGTLGVVALHQDSIAGVVAAVARHVHAPTPVGAGHGLGREGDLVRVLAMALDSNGGTCTMFDQLD